MKSIKEYPKATKIEIPLTLSGLSAYFRISDSVFRYRADFLQSTYVPLTFSGGQSHFYPRYTIKTPPIYIDERDIVGTREYALPRKLVLVELSEDGVRHIDVLTLTLDVSGSVPQLVITLLVPVPELRDRTIIYIDYVRARVQWRNTQPVQKDAEVYVKGVREMMLMKTALVDRGLAEDAAQDQAMRTLLPEGLARLLRPDSEGGSADARKRGKMYLNLVQAYIARHPD